MESKGFQLIPTEVIKAWTQGEYYVGEIPSISYHHLGNALLLRGWYTYVDENEERANWAGVARVDIKGPVLSMGGLRLFGDHMVFWITVDSYVRDDKIIWFYKGYNCPPESANGLFDKYLKQDRPRDSKIPDKRFGLEEEDWRSLLVNLATNFDVDVEEAKRLCQGNIDNGVLEFGVSLDPQGFRRCDYHHYGSVASQPLTGCSRFTKVKV
jgi:hypothetical protein